MKREYGVALKEFMRSRDYTTASPDLKKLYGEYKGWDNFIEEAKILGFKWNQIYFVKNLVESYNCEDVDNLKWLLLNILKKYDLGNLRSSIDSLNVLEDKVLDAQGIIDVNKELDSGMLPRKYKIKAIERLEYLLSMEYKLEGESNE